MGERVKNSSQFWINSLGLRRCARNEALLVIAKICNKKKGRFLETILNVQHLSIGKQDNEQTVLLTEKLSFSLEKGKTLALLGRSGSGKTLTALAIAGLLPANLAYLQGGTIHFDGMNLLDAPEYKLQELRAARIAYLFQEPGTAFNPIMSLGQQMDELLRVHTALKKKERQKRCLNALKEVGLSDPKRCYQLYPHQLSGGMKQRALLALILLGNPEILIADEPTSALDPENQAIILKLIQSLQVKMNLSLILITHDIAVARRYSDHIAVLYSGQMIEFSETALFFKGPKHPYSELLLQSQLEMRSGGSRLTTLKDEEHQALSGCYFSKQCQHSTIFCQTHSVPMVALSQDHEVRCFLYTGDLKTKQEKLRSDLMSQSVAAKPSSSLPPLLRIMDLTVSYPIQKGMFRRTVGQVCAVRGVDFTLFPEKTLAIVGHSGSGKSSLAKALFGLAPQKTRSILWNDQSIRMPYLLGKMQLIFQDPAAALDPRMTVEQLLKENNPATFKAEARQRIKQALTKVGLDDTILMRYPHEFSGGQRQRICIARALMSQSKIWVLDEATSALDTLVKAQILNLLKDLQAEFQLSYLFISHDWDAIAFMADEIALMKDGIFIRRGAKADILNQLMPQGL